MMKLSFLASADLFFFYKFVFTVTKLTANLSFKLIPKRFIYIFFFFFNLFKKNFGCIGSLLLHAGFLQLRRAGATLRHGAQASHRGGFSCCGAPALGSGLQQLWLAGSRAQAQQLLHTGLVAPQHVVSSRTRARTCVP